MTVPPAKLAPLPTRDLSTSLPRKVAAAVVFLLAIGLAVLFGVGSWNPWRNVVLLEWFADPFLGALLIATAVYAGLWLLLPIRNSATQRGRAAVRVAVLVIGFIGLMGFGLYGTHLIHFEGTEIARSEDGTLVVARVEQAGVLDSQIHIWRGEGLGTVDVARVGPDCAPSDVWRFVDGSTIEVENSYGTFQIRLDPETGVPLDQLVACDQVAP